MSLGTKIEWASLGLGPGRSASWTPIRARRRERTIASNYEETRELIGWHCEHVSPGCEKCYSERQNIAGARGGTKLPFKPGHRKDVEIYLDEKTLLEPLHWRSPRGVFVCSMTDLFGDWVSDEWIDHIMAVAALCPQHRFAVLTKRSKRMREYCNDPKTPRRIYDLVCDLSVALELDVILIAPGIDPIHAPPGARVFLSTWPLPNVWLLVSAEDQQRADERIPDLLATAATVRGVSIEPMLGPVDISRHDQSRFWVICGGESGTGARPMHPDWAKSLRDQCAAAGTAFFFKQWGEWKPADHSDFPTGKKPVAWPGQDGPVSIRVGKARAGRVLDGQEHSAFPEIAP
jgi:protein gp37